MSTIRIISKGVLFWFLWILATLTGFLVYWALFQVSGVEAQLISSLEARIGVEGANLRILEFATNGLLGLIEGLIIGLFQWFAIRGRIKHALAWISTTGLGFALGLLAFWAIFITMTGNQLPQGNPTEWAFGVGLLRSSMIGLCLGLMQWFVLYRQFRGHVIWAPIVVLAFIGSWFCQWFISEGLAFIVVGAVTGIPLTLKLVSKERAIAALEEITLTPEVVEEDPLKRLNRLIP